MDTMKDDEYVSIRSIEDLDEQLLGDLQEQFSLNINMIEYHNEQGGPSSRESHDHVEELNCDDDENHTLQLVLHQQAHEQKHQLQEYSQARSNQQEQLIQHHTHGQHHHHIALQQNPVMGEFQSQQLPGGWGFRAFERVRFVNEFGEPQERIRVAEWAPTHDTALNQVSELTKALSMLRDDHYGLHRAVAKTFCEAETALDRLRGQVQEHVDGVYGEGRTLRGIVDEQGQRLHDFSGRVEGWCKENFSHIDNRLNALLSSMGKKEVQCSFENELLSLKQLCLSTNELVDSMAHEREELDGEIGNLKQALNAFEVEVNQLRLTVDMMESEVGPLKTAFSKFQLEIATNLEKIRQNMDNQLERDRAEFLDEVHTLRRQLTMEKTSRESEKKHFEQQISSLVARIETLENKRGVQRSSPMKAPGDGVLIQVASLAAEIQVLKVHFDSVHQSLSALEERFLAYDTQHAPQLNQLSISFKGHLTEFSELKLSLAKLRIDSEANESLLQHVRAKQSSVSPRGTNPSPKVPSEAIDRIDLAKLHNLCRVAKDKSSKAQVDVLGCLQDCASLRGELMDSIENHRSLKGEFDAHLTSMHSSSARRESQPSGSVTFAVDAKGNPLSPNCAYIPSGPPDLQYDELRAQEVQHGKDLCLK